MFMDSTKLEGYSIQYTWFSKIFKAKEEGLKCLRPSSSILAGFLGGAAIFLELNSAEFSEVRQATPSPFNFKCYANASIG